MADTERSEGKSDVKDRILAALVRLLNAEHETLTVAAQAAAEAATHEESKPENEYDTRGLEASYLAGAQRERVAELEATIKVLGSTILKRFDADTPIAATALVDLDQDGQPSRCLLLSRGGGHTLRVDGRPVLTISPQSPLGRALLGRRVGDVVSVEVGGVEKDYEIVEVG